MSVLLRLTLFMAFLISAPFSLYTQGHTQTAAVVGSITTGMQIDNTMDRLNGLVERFEQAGDFLAVRAAQEARYVLEAFERTNKNILDKAFEGIGAERQAILNQVRRTADDIEQGRLDTLEKLTAASDQFERLVRETTFKNMPVVFRYRGTIVTPGETQDIRILVEGYKLTRGNPRLIFRDQGYKAKKDGEKLRFELSRNIFEPEDSRFKSEDATLVLEGREGGIFGWFASEVTVEYQINILTLPKQLASVDVAYVTKVATPNERVVPIAESHNSSSRKADCKSFAYSPAAADRKFDLERTFVRRSKSGNRRGWLKNVRITETGISFKICAYRGFTDKDNGFRHAEGQYVEVWSTPTESARTKRGIVSWTKNVAIPVDPPVDKLLITVSDFAGVTRTVPTSGGKVGRYAEVLYDAQSKAVIVNPIVPLDLERL